jgi:hypothetical protein
MNDTVDFHIPGCSEFRLGYTRYNERERRGPIWFDALRIIERSWGNPTEMEIGVNLIIRGWNRFYARYDRRAAVRSIRRNLGPLGQLRLRPIASLSDQDENIIRRIFRDFHDSLKRQSDSQRSAVSVGKALSLFAPYFLPIWDSNIAWRYDCWYFDAHADLPYYRFCKKMKMLADRVRDCVPLEDDRPLLKRIDEFNYSKYTMGWI